MVELSKNVRHLEQALNSNIDKLETEKYIPYIEEVSN